MLKMFFVLEDYAVFQFSLQTTFATIYYTFVWTNELIFMACTNNENFPIYNKYL